MLVPDWAVVLVLLTFLLAGAALIALVVLSFAGARRSKRESDEARQPESESTGRP